MVKAIMMSKSIPSQGIQRLVVLPTDIFIEAKCKEEKGYAITFSSGDDETELEVSLAISQEDYETLKYEGPEDYFCGSYEHDTMARWIMLDIARYFIEDYDPRSGHMIIDVDRFISDWEGYLEELADSRRERRERNHTPSYKEDYVSDNDGETDE